MPNSFIEYRGGYKYQLAADYSIKINIKPEKDIDTKFIKLDTKGNLTIIEGYAWDGPSGPVDRHKREHESLSGARCSLPTYAAQKNNR